MGTSNKPLQTGYTRVFLIAGRARGDHRPEYYSSLKMGALSQSFGDVTKIEIPDPDEYNKYIEIDRIRGAVERATFNLMGRYAAAVKSRLLTLAHEGCPVDIQLHMGECTDPTAFNTFTKAIIAEDSIITNHSTDDLGALESGEAAVVNETADISAREYYEVVPMTFVSRAGDAIVNHVNDIIITDSASCGNCSVESDGCQRVFAVTDLAGGSPGTPPDILYSGDGGTTWAAHDVDTLTAAQNAESVAGVGDYVVVVSNIAGSLNYAEIQDFIDGIDPVFTEVTTGFVAGGSPNHIWSLGRESYIVGDNGYIYYTDDPAAGVEVLDAGAATADDLRFIHALDDEHVVAVGDNGAVVFANDGESFDAAPVFPVGVGINLTSVWVKNDTEWWVTSSNGKVFYTLNSGKSWTEKVMPGTTPTKMNRIAFSKDSVGFASGVVSSHARIYRTFDGGYSWVVLPEGTGSMPLADEFLGLTICENDPNIVLAAGIADNATDGVIILGKG